MAPIITLIINILLIILYLAILIRIIKSTKEQLGYFYAVFLILMVFLPNLGKSKTEKSIEIHKSGFFEPVFPKGRQSSTFITLEKNRVSELSLMLTHINADTIYFPIDAKINKTGIEIGIDFVPNTISLAKSNTPNKYYYSITGIEKYKLLNTNFYTKFRIFKGEINLN